MRHVRQAAQRLAASRRQLRAARKAERHIGAKLGRQHGKLRFIQSLGEEFVHAAKHSGGIRRAARESRRHRNLFFQADRCAACRRKAPQEKRRRTPCEVALVGGKRCALDFQGDALRRLLQLHLIRQGDGLHDHLHLVVAVGAFSQNIERQIDLRPRQKLQQVKCTVLSIKTTKTTSETTKTTSAARLPCLYFAERLKKASRFTKPRHRKASSFHRPRFYQFFPFTASLRKNFGRN